MKRWVIVFYSKLHSGWNVCLPWNRHCARVWRNRRSRTNPETLRVHRHPAPALDKTVDIFFFNQCKFVIHYTCIYYYFLPVCRRVLVIPSIRTRYHRLSIEFCLSSTPVRKCDSPRTKDSPSIFFWAKRLSRLRKSSRLDRRIEYGRPDRYRWNCGVSNYRMRKPLAAGDATTLSRDSPNSPVALDS